MSYVPVSIFGSDDPMDIDRLNRLVTNQQAIHRNTPRFRYSAYGVTRTEGLRIAAGTIDCSHATSRQRTRGVSVGTFFSPSSRPVGVASCSTLAVASVFIKIAQRNANSVNLERSGMQITLRKLDAKPLRPAHVINYVMIGY